MERSYKTNTSLSLDAYDVAMWERTFRRSPAQGNWGIADWIICAVLYPSLLIALPGAAWSVGRILSAPDGDIAYYWMWQRYFFQNMVREHGLSQLNAFIMAGTPFFGAMQSSVLYPLNLLHLVGDMATALNLELLLHWWLTLCGFHVLGQVLAWGRAARCLGALVGGFSGWAVLHYWQGHLPFILEMTVTPWLLSVWIGWSLGRMSNLATLLATATLIAFQFSAGHPQIVYFTLLIMAWSLPLCWWLMGKLPCKRRVQRLVLPALGFVLGAGLVGVQALPTLLHMRSTIRGAENVPLQYYTAQSMPWTNLLTLIAPWVWGGWPGRDPYVGAESMWEVVGFVSATGFALAFLIFCRPGILSRFQVLYGLLAVFGLLLATGEYSGIYEMLRTWVPGLSLFRNPGRALYVSTVSFALLAGEGITRLTFLASKHRDLFLSLLSRGWLGLGAGVALVLILFSDGIRSPIFLQLLLSRTSEDFVSRLTRPEVVRLFNNFQVNLVGAGFMIGLALAFVTGFLWHRTVTWATWGLVAATAFELTQFARPYMVSFPAEIHEWSNRTVSFLRGNCERYRITSIRTPADLNQGMRWGVRHIWGYEPTVSLRYASAMAVSQGREPGFPEAWLNVYQRTPLVNSLAARYLIAPPRANLQQYGWRLVLDTIECSVHENSQAIPRGFVVGEAQVVDPRDVLRLVNSSDFMPTSTVLLETGDPNAEATSASLTHKTVTVTKDVVEEFVAEVETDAPAWFVLMDQYLPGWSARVDGQTVPISRANAVGMAVRFPSGRHQISFVYREPGLAAGSVLSGVSLCIYLMVALAWLTQRRKKLLNSQS